MERDYTALYDKFVALGPGVKKNGLGVHGVKYACGDFWDSMVENGPSMVAAGTRCPSLEYAELAADAVTTESRANLSRRFLNWPALPV